MSTNHKASFGFPLEYVADIDSAKRFFVDVLGLKIDRDHPTFVQFSAPNGASYAIASDEPMDPNNGRGTELWWVVEDAQAAFSRMSSQAQVTMPLREMPFGTCFGVKDPAGQVHYLLEFAQERPSRQV
jgi:predicted enzyme related to lactoylglutathione lyase